MINKITVLFLLISITITYSCGSEDTNKYTSNVNCSSVPAENTYGKTVKPILDASCAFAGCHDTQTKAEGIILDTYEGAKASFVSGKGLCSINHDGCNDMPQGSPKLPAATLNILACWVKNNTPQ